MIRERDVARSSAFFATNAVAVTETLGEEMRQQRAVLGPQKGPPLAVRTVATPIRSMRVTSTKQVWARFTSLLVITLSTVPDVVYLLNIDYGTVSLLVSKFKDLALALA